MKIMKKIIFNIIISFAFVSSAITLDARRVANVSDMKNNTGASSARSSENYNTVAYEISVAKGKYDKGKYVLFAMTIALMMESNGGTKTTRVYVWIPDSYKTIDIEKFGKSRFLYTTPIAKFEKEKWEYIGDYSKGAKLNGVFIGICDVSLPKPKIVKFFKQCSANAPKSMDEVEKLSSNQKIQGMLDELGYFDTSMCDIVQFDANGKLPALKTKSDEPKLDDDESISANISSSDYIAPKMFKASMPKMKPVTYSCECEIDDLYDYEFSDCKNTHWSVNIKAYTKDGEDYEPLWGYVPKSSPLGKKIIQILSDGKKHKMILTVMYTKKAEGSDTVAIVGMK